jgi:hypothetical protein
MGLMSSGHDLQILKRSLATFAVTLGEPSIRFHGRTSPDSSDILLLYSIGVRVEANVPSLVTRRLNSMTVSTANFTLVDFYLESL